MVAFALDRPDEVVRFPAPWPRDPINTVAVAGDLSVAVFAGVHALRAVEPGGRLRWEVRHGCWDSGCFEQHESYEEYAGGDDHRYPDTGSAVFSPDGSLVWAHVRSEDAVEGAEVWLVLDAADGRVLARAETGTVAAGSDHIPHPDPAQMGLSIGEGQDGVPLRWGRFDGRELTVEYLGSDERVLLAVSPSGKRLLTVTHYQESLALHDADGGAVLCELDADGTVPVPPTAEPLGEDENGEPDFDLRWDYHAGFVDEDTVVTATAESDEEWGLARHWLVAAEPLRLLGEIRYPFPVRGYPYTLGDGTWATVGEGGDTVHVWELGARG
ncbi:hypothetical protein KV557_22040 [Kitasatospora aureofaciens]|nr:hypothetical protein [Kitasatospora aureofaciens]